MTVRLGTWEPTRPEDADKNVSEAEMGKGKGPGGDALDAFHHFEWVRHAGMRTRRGANRMRPARVIRAR